jgi:hypothetical protein
LAAKFMGASIGRSAPPCYGVPVIFEAITREYGGYIFDSDGTLADSMVVHHRAWLAALAAHGAVFDFNLGAVYEPRGHDLAEHGA